MDVDDNIERAVNYILRNFKENNQQFYDRSVVGTGHRGVLNLQYPSYAYSFPLIALSRVRNLIKGSRNLKLNKGLNEAFVKHNATFADEL